MEISKLNEARKKAGFSIEELSQKANLEKSTVEKVLFGVVKNPRVDTLQAIERALGLAPEPTDEEKALGMSRTAPIALSDKDKRRLTMLMEADEVLGEERVDMALSLIELSVEAEKNKK